MLVTQLERKFILKKDNKDVILEDINPNLSHQQICDVYSNTYPELVNSKIIVKGIINDQEVIKFSTIAGTKG